MKVSHVFSLLILGASALGFAQGGQGGFGGLGGGAGFQGGGQGPQVQTLEEKASAISSAIGAYLNGPEIKSLLTPGEFVEWKIKLKAGQVMFAEAWSDAFDPALEITDDKDKVLASNDDRFPGDQRPLLMWRCPVDGNYSLRARCFHDKSGGQVFVRFNSYDSFDIGSGPVTEHSVNSLRPFLVRVPMKKGELKEIQLAQRNDPDAMYVGERTIISPLGLPDIGLASSLERLGGNFLMAPVAGDYYIFMVPGGVAIRANDGLQNRLGGGGRLGAAAPKSMNSGEIDDSSTQEVKLKKVWVGYRDALPGKVELSNESGTAKVDKETITVLELDVKAGQFIEASMDGLEGCATNLVEAPKYADFDLAKSETNPFFPQPPKKGPDGPAIQLFSVRARDPRGVAFYANRDAKIWFEVKGWGGSGSFDVTYKPAAANFLEGSENQGKLGIGRTNYWYFNLNAGDVMTCSSKAQGYVNVVAGFAPGWQEVHRSIIEVDNQATRWTLIAQKPGRYYLGVSCFGDGGSGTYQLERKVIHARNFGVGTPAADEIASGQVQIWKFTVKPEEPLLAHWLSPSGDYSAEIYDEKGNRVGWDERQVDKNNMFSLLTVEKPTTYLVVFTGSSPKAKYSLDVTPLKKG